MNALAGRLLEQAPPAETAPPSVREVFAALKIRPFTPESVARYKAAKIHSHRLRWWDRLAHAIEQRITLHDLCTILTGLSAIMFAGGLLAFVLEMWPPAGQTAPSAKWFVLAGSIGVVLSGVLRVLDETWDYRTTEPDWFVVGPIEECTQEIGCPHCVVAVPLPVAHKARQVRAQLPGATFFVEELWQATRLDPFLVVRHEGQEFHLAVWDEDGYAPEFDADAARASS